MSSAGMHTMPSRKKTSAFGRNRRAWFYAVAVVEKNRTYFSNNSFIFFVVLFLLPFGRPRPKLFPG
jgi:hypothetical protein